MRKQHYSTTPQIQCKMIIDVKESSLCQWDKFKHNKNSLFEWNWYFSLSKQLYTTTNNMLFKKQK